MNTSTRFKIVLGMLAVAASAQALADDTPRSSSGSFARPWGGWNDGDTSRPWSPIPMTSYGYVGASAGLTKFGLPGCGPGASCDDADIGFKVYAGGQFSRVFGVEVSYVDMGRLDRNGGDVRARGVNVGLVANWPLAEQVNVFGKIGAIYAWTRTGSPVAGVVTGNRSDMNLSYGLGAQYDIDRHWAVRADMDVYRVEFTTGRDNATLFSLGGVYKF